MAASVTIQCASLAFWLPLEIYQMDTLGHPTFVVFLRFKNIAAFALGSVRLGDSTRPVCLQIRGMQLTSQHGIFCRRCYVTLALLHSGQLMFSMLYGPVVALALVFAAVRLYRIVFDPAYRMEDYDYQLRG